jgi:acyl-CoA thioesterase FadM
LKSLGLNLDETTPVVMEAHAFYRKFLTAGDRYRVDLQVYRERLAYHFISRITNLATNDLSFEADQVIVFYTNWKAVRKDVVAEAMTAKGLSLPYPIPSKRVAGE